MAADHNLLDVMPFSVKEAVDKLPDDLITMSESDLRRKVKPTSTEYALRVAFWREFEIAMSRKKKMDSQHVWRGICYYEYFHKLLRSGHKTAWLIKPLMSYEKRMDALLSRAVERLEEILDLPITSANGKTDLRAAHIVLTAAKQIEDRVKGMAVARSMNVHKHDVSARAPHGGQGLSVQELDDQINKLEAEIEKGGAPPASLPPAQAHIDIELVKDDTPKEEAFADLPKDDEPVEELA